MNLKDELLKVYRRRISDFQNIRNVFKDENNSGPFLMSPSENYSNQPFPFLVIGQESKGWGNLLDVVSEEECLDMMAVYEKFNLGETYYASPFWNVIRKIEAKLGNIPYSCAFTNISKYDQDEGRPDEEHEKIFSTLDNLLIEEVRITKPKICIFFTSHNFDYRLKDIFEQIEFVKIDGFDTKTLCQLKHPDLPTLTYRTYHPRFLRQSGLEESFLEFITKQTKMQSS